MKLFMRPIC